MSSTPRTQKAFSLDTKPEFRITGLGQAKEFAESLELELANTRKELEEAKGQLETELMRIVACDVVAMSDTPESAEKAREMRPDYKSAALESVIRRVDECIGLRSKLAASEARNKELAEALDGVMPIFTGKFLHAQEHEKVSAARAIRGK